MRAKKCADYHSRKFRGPNDINGGRLRAAWNGKERIRKGQNWGQQTIVDEGLRKLRSFARQGAAMHVAPLVLRWTSGERPRRRQLHPGQTAKGWRFTAYARPTSSPRLMDIRRPLLSVGRPTQKGTGVVCCSWDTLLCHRGSQSALQQQGDLS